MKVICAISELRTLKTRRFHLLLGSPCWRAHVPDGAGARTSAAIYQALNAHVEPSALSACTTHGVDLSLQPVST